MSSTAPQTRPAVSAIVTTFNEEQHIAGCLKSLLWCDEILESIGGGRMIVAYSGGLHHVQAPGERWPRLFKTIRIRLEALDIARYREQILERAGHRGFKKAVIEDLERRRDAICPPLEKASS